jgi:hypothetical protein
MQVAHVCGVSFEWNNKWLRTLKNKMVIPIQLALFTFSSTHNNLARQALVCSAQSSSAPPMWIEDNLTYLSTKSKENNLVLHVGEYDMISKTKKTSKHTSSNIQLKHVLAVSSASFLRWHLSGNAPTLVDLLRKSLLSHSQWLTAVDGQSPHWTNTVFPGSW